MARWDREASSEIPDWFWAAVETESQEHTVEVGDCDVFFKTWGDPSKAPMLLIHGMNAHCRWWDFIAPQLTDEYYIAAMDLTGMGDSDYRYEYDAETYGLEIVGVCDAAGLSNDVVVVGHSFGGMMSAKAATVRQGRFGSLILVDSGIRHPDEPEPDRPGMGGQRAKVYPSRADGESRFRLYPPQPCENDYIMKYIAKQSLMPVDGGGFAWKFDEDLPTSLKGGERQAEDYSGLKLPVGIIYGEDSELFSGRMLDYMLELIPSDVPVKGIEHAQHHVFLDQPLDFIAALRDMAAELRGRNG